MGPAGRTVGRVTLATAVVLSAIALSTRTGTTAPHPAIPRDDPRSVPVPAGSPPGHGHGQAHAQLG
ncbi:hypothetical protein GCM10023335_53330 [Streptomyces siamensis]|uniref:Uncharacterized protein n=1 Tax=Streptomyces siamensis TaxID=1274986 RepID=A0ABP9J835_9ACTN